MNKNNIYEEDLPVDVEELPFCVIGGCEALREGCQKTCPLSTSNNANLRTKPEQLCTEDPIRYIDTDLVEVVRCKDCRYYGAHGSGKFGICKYHSCQGLRKATDFCSYGKR